MKLKTIFALVIACFSFYTLAAQSTAPAQLQLPAKRTARAVKIDGLVTDSAWQDAAIMTNLVEFRPAAGKVENHENRTITYLMYDDEGIYFGGYCYERTRDSIASELRGRDGFGTNDYVGLILDTYYDKLNGFEYFVTPLGEQWDAKMSPNQNGNSEDFSWNAVWQSGAVVHNDGWSFEMFIPYSAIRFGKKEVQNWGLNITRRRRKTEQQYTWNPIDPNVNGFLTQEGLWVGISNIKPPLRLQFSPYFSTYVNHYPLNKAGQKNWTSSVNGGMDVKYGISQAFTLDMTLIPDFGQVQSDRQILNLGPFETRFTEQRPFFTEGTELFNKGNYFYPRRIGLDPILVHNLAEYMTGNDTILKDPVESKLINATKISGRTQKGLGIGVLNAVTNTRYATLEDRTTKDQRKVVIDPLTNYSVIVLNQSLKNNSSVSLVNTNVLRNGPEYDANVTAGLFDFNDKKNMWNVGGKFATSNLIGYLPNDETQTGYSHNLYFAKTSGRFNFNVGQELTTEKFNSNDLGYFSFGNYLDHFAWTGYRWTKPGKWYNSLYLNVNAFYSRLLKYMSPYAGLYKAANVNVNVNGQMKNLWYVGALIGYEPKFNDFYEPRKKGRFFPGWSNMFYDLWFESNASKKYSLYSELMFVDRSLFDSKRFQFNFNHRYRFGNKLSVSQGIYMEPQTNNVGFAAFWGMGGDTVVFGKRDRNAIESTVEVKYNFNAKMGLRTIIRHYWSKVDYKEFYVLEPNGDLTPFPGFNRNVNQNVNFFNVDMMYTWEFAPGSFINIVWKNAADHFTREVQKSYFKNIDRTMEADQNNNLSLKVIYFLDYLKLKKKKKGDQ